MFGAVVFSAVFLTVVCVGGWLFFRASKRALVTHTATHLSAIADLKAEQLAIWREDVLREGRFQKDSSPDSPRLRNLLSERSSSRELRGLRDWLLRVADNFDADEVSLVDLKGRLRLNARGTIVKGGLSAASRDIARRAVSTDQILLSPLHLSQTIGEADLDLAVPLTAGSGDRLGALVVHLSADRFIEPIVQQWPGASDTGECMLVRREGDEYVVLNELRFKPGAVLRLRESSLDDESPAALAVRGVEGFLRGRDYRGEMVYAEARDIRETEWHLLVKIDENEALSPLIQNVSFIIGVSVILTLLAVFGLLYWSARHDSEALARELAAERERLDLSERFAALMREANDAVFMIDEWLRILETNARAESLFGYTRDEFLAMKLDHLTTSEGPLMSRKIDAGRGTLFETFYRHKNGSLLPVEVSVSQVEVKGRNLYLALVRDIGDRRREQEARRMNEQRLNALLEFAQIPLNLSEKELLEVAIEKIVALTRSRVGYVHVIDDDQHMLHLMTWSKEALKGCTAPQGGHYSLDQAGLWADSFRLRDVIVHNDYAAAAGKKGLPAEPFPFKRHMGVTVFDAAGKGRLILGVGDKATDYDEADVRLILIVGEEFWKAVFARRSQSALASSESERSRVEDQLRQVQRLETVGRLAGGVAHDFNNILTALLGHCALLKDSFAPTDARLDDLNEIEAAGLRAAGLTRQLLAFSRRQRVAPAPMDMNAVVRGLQSMIRRLIGEDIRISTVLCERPWTVLADPGQMEQILLNLAVNSRDAMPKGGALAFSTFNEVLSEPLMTRHGVIEPGRYLRLMVQDDGEGMSRQVLEHLFEPFFTTKVQGKGTGLGLATVYGIVQQSGGAISVESAPGAGSAFIVRWPAGEGEVAQKAAPAAAARCSGTILLVEDEEAVRRLVERVLNKAGCKVVAAAGGHDGQARFLEDPNSFDLLLTDLVMPGMDGRSLARVVRAARPGLPVIFMSGYDDPERVDLHGAGERFLQKPLEAASLLAEVAAALARPSS